MPKLYEQKPGISQEKYRDLMKLCHKHLIPQYFHSFNENFAVQNDVSAI